MTLLDLIPEAGAEAAQVEIGGISADSRTVRPGDAFVALAGSKADGLRFVEAALAAGAVAIVAEARPPSLAPGVAFVKVASARRALALAAARLYPRQPATVAAVTGTSGKTSVAAFARQIWTRLGRAAASIGTVGLVAPNRTAYGSLTTPDPVALHRSLDALAREGVTHLALEASSHGLDQHRLDGVRVTAGAFTNLSRDHLDYHPTLEAYFAAKLRLFDEVVVDGGAAVVASDHPESEEVAVRARRRGLRVLTVGRTGEAIRLSGAVADGFAQRLTIDCAGRAYAVRLPLVGAFQVENALVAAGLALASGEAAHDVLPALEGLTGARGRLDLVGQYNGAPVFVDYAHKPDALAKALEALRPYVRGRLVVVFGAGGDRDPGKRRIMGEVAAAKADHIIVTDDNPRSEDPAAIRAAIMSGATQAREIGDRAQAIRTAIAELQDGDVLLIAGKGHETGQIVGDRTLPFSDHDVAVAALGGRTS